MPPLLGKPYDFLPEGGPAFDTGALGGPEGLSPQMMALWSMARGMQQDPSGGLQPGSGVVVGPGRQHLLNLLPAKLGSFIQRMPEMLLADVPKVLPGNAGEFTPASKIAQNVGILGRVQYGPTEGADTAVHEVLHALYARKFPESGGQIPSRLAYPIWRDRALQDPSLHEFAQIYRPLTENYGQLGKNAIREGAIEALARTMMRRNSLPWSR